MDDRVDFSGNPFANYLFNDPNYSESSDRILQALIASKEKGTSIGIKAFFFGPDMYVTAVEDILIEDGQTVVKLKHYDANGYILPSYKINLLEIQAVYSFSTPFKNPFMKLLATSIVKETRENIEGTETTAISE